uniref:FUN14 domain-containing protein 2 n=1 Tax=Monodelphis domestica TaxID=13616 RepID=A0A5F8GW77_MONDO
HLAVENIELDLRPVQSFRLPLDFLFHWAVSRAEFCSVFWAAPYRGVATAPVWGGGSQASCPGVHSDFVFQISAQFPLRSIDRPSVLFCRCTGFIFQKVGKLAATAVGGGFFLLQIANHTGYIKVDWQRVEKDMKKAKEQLKIRRSNQLPTEVKSKAEEVVSFVKKNVLVTGGFFGGFLLGMAS